MIYELRITTRAQRALRNRQSQGKGRKAGRSGKGTEEFSANEFLLAVHTGFPTNRNSLIVNRK
jgi:hypothetical protein